MVDCLTVRVCELEQSLCEEQERREELQAENADLLDRMKLAEELCTGERMNFMFFFIPANFSMHIDTVSIDHAIGLDNKPSMNLFILYFDGSRSKFKKNNINNIFLSLKIVCILANSADADEMAPYDAMRHFI